MEDHYLESHLRDLFWTAKERGYVTSSAFLTPQEIAGIKAIFPQNSIVIYGGFDQFERAITMFLPDFISPEVAISNEIETNEIVSCLRIETKSGKFSRSLNHRDYLGAILGLGIEREQIGDILIEDGIAYVFVLSGMSSYVEDSLKQVGSENVSVSKIPCSDCPASIHFEEKTFSVSSIRLDLLIAGAFNTSRETAQKLIQGDLAKVDTAAQIENSTVLKEGDRVSVRGKGKFIYKGEQGKSKKGKAVVKILLYR